MATRADLRDWVVDALRSNGGSATILFVAKHIWQNHEKDLKGSDELFFSWQYDMRWAASSLRRKGVITAAGDDRKGVWSLAS